MTACMGKGLWMDLSKGTFTEEGFGDEVYKNYLSGVGLAAHLLYNSIPAGADPLGPENILEFVSGLLTGTPSLFSRSTLTINPVFCQCSAGFTYRPFEVIFGRALQAGVLESVLQGDPVCRFAIHLPD